MASSINIGIIGLGRWGTNYLQTLTALDDFVITALCSRTEAALEKAMMMERLTSKPLLTTDFDQVIAGDTVDAVAIVTPGTTHYALTRKALLAGKHVIVEKPLSFSASQARELIDLAKVQGKILLVGHLHLYNPAIRKLKDDIDAGIFGKIRYIESIGTGNGPIRDDMNALWDFFSHDASIILYLLGIMPLQVCTHGASYIKGQVEDVVTTSMMFSQGIYTSTFSSWLHPLKQKNLVVVGEKKYAAYADYAQQDKLRYCDAPTNIAGGFGFDNKFAVQTYPDLKPLTEQLLHFIHCIRNGKVPVSGGQEAIDVAHVLEAAQQSLEAGVPIKLR